MIRNYLTANLLCGLVVLLPTIMMAQSFDLPTLQTEYPKEDVVYLERKEHLILFFDEADALAVKKQHEASMLFLTDKDLRHASESIHYSDFSSIEDIVAETRVFNKRNKAQRIPVEEISTQDVMVSGIFYGDYKKKSFVFPAVQQGALTYLSYSEVIKDPRMLGSFYFNSYVPLINAEYSVSFPENVSVSYQLIGENTDQIAFSESAANGQKTYTWRANDMQKYERESGALSRNYYNPHIILRIDRIKRDAEEERILSDVTDLYRWYSSLVQEINQTDQNELKQIVADLVEGVSDEREKTRILYQWVQSNISYVAFEDGMGGFIPRDAAAVCTKKYGDCKDMANILREMLTYADVEAYLTWIGTREKPYSYRDVPTPVVDNHMITAVKLDGKIQFFDATGTHTPFGYPTSMIQGKEALVGINADSFEIIKVPVMEMKQNRLVDSSFLSLEAGNVIGRGYQLMTGYQKVDLEYSRYRIDGQDEKLFMNDYLTKGKDNFQLDDFKITGLGDQNLDGEISYDFRIPSYAKTVSNRIYVNLNLDRPLQASAIDIEQRRYGREIDYKYLDSYFVELEIPEGYSIYKMPENLSYEDDKWGFRINYRQDGNKIILEKEIYMNALAIHKSDFEAWNTFIQKLNKAHKKNLVLTQ